MNRKKLWLMAAAMALPVFASAGQPDAARPAPQPALPEVIVLPVGFPQMPMPAMPMFVMPNPQALIRQVALMQRQMEASMAVLQRLAARPISVPAGAKGFTEISMTTISGPQGACGESMTIVPGRDGKPVVSVRRIGHGCGHLAVSMPGGAPAQAAPHRPANALPPPSKLIYADYKLPAKAAGRPG